MHRINLLVVFLLLSAWGEAQTESPEEPGTLDRANRRLIERKRQLQKESLFYSVKPSFECPMTYLPLGRLDVHLPLGESAGGLPVLWMPGGHYVYYPSESLPFGVLGGVSFGRYGRQSFTGNFDYQGGRESLEVDVFSALNSGHLGAKFVNRFSAQRVKPYAECFVSRTALFTRFTIDTRDAEEEEPSIESRRAQSDVAHLIHLNIGGELNLQSELTLKREGYQGRGYFLCASLGYAQSLNEVVYLDAGEAVVKPAGSSSPPDMQTISSFRTSFSAELPRYQSRLQMLSLSIGVVIRI